LARLASSNCTIFRRGGALSDLPRSADSQQNSVGSVGRGPVDTRRSYYLACRQDDFAEAPAETLRLESYEMLYAAPAQSRLSVRCWKLFRSLVAGICSAG